MKNFLDDDNDLDNHSQVRKPSGLNRGFDEETGFYDDSLPNIELDDEDFDDDSEQANDGEYDSHFDSDLESQSSDDNNF